MLESWFYIKSLEVKEDDSKEGTPVAGTPKLGTNGVDLSSLTSEEKLVMALEEESRMATEARACTGYFPSCNMMMAENVILHN